MKFMAQKGKITIKKWDFRAKSVFLGVNSNELATNLERQNGAKCRLCS